MALSLTPTETSGVEYFVLSAAFVTLTSYLAGEPTLHALAVGLTAGIVTLASVLHVSLPSATTTQSAAK
jgi:hypothetical protein